MEFQGGRTAVVYMRRADARNKVTDQLGDLPSLFQPIALREGGDAIGGAVARAPAGGAGTLVWVRSHARAEAAIVLEPDLPLAAARLALLAGANALADALAALGPPERPVALRWPATVLVDGAACGALQLAEPPDADENAVPAWLVVGFELALERREDVEPGLDPGRTALRAEGFELDAATLTAAWARHLMAALDEWQARGVPRLAERFLARLADPAQRWGLRRGIDPATGALVLDEAGARSIRPLV
jgi:BirA family transcriptional regulator, biotin operon repressor / biotin---[acetyl-CoA-carboxylase] ligase